MTLFQQAKQKIPIKKLQASIADSQRNHDGTRGFDKAGQTLFQRTH